MPSKTELAMAAVRTLQNDKKEVTLEAVNELIEKIAPGQSVSKQLLYLAGQKLKKEPADAGTPLATGRTFLEGDFDQFLTMVEMARALIEAAGGDRDKVIKLIQIA